MVNLHMHSDGVRVCTIIPRRFLRRFDRHKAERDETDGVTQNIQDVKDSCRRLWKHNSFIEHYYQHERDLDFSLASGRQDII